MLLCNWFSVAPEEGLVKFKVWLILGKVGERAEVGQQ